MKNKSYIYIILVLIVVIVLGGYMFMNNKKPASVVACTMEAKLCPDGSSVGRVAPSCEFAACPNVAPTITYSNTQYGFSIELPNTWKGYTVLATKWQGRDVATGNVTETGPLVTLRHPLWTTASPREDMPVMVFTPAQWTKVQNEKLAVSAAPIPPSLLGQNSKFILALPPRYNFDYKTGWEEVDKLVHTLKAFEPTVADATGQHCGGFIANAPTCPDGYSCKLNIIADTGGVCVKN